MKKGKIHKPDGAITNTFRVIINGRSIKPDMTMQAINADVHFTSNEHGEILSVYDPSTKREVAMPFGEVEELIRTTRAALAGKDNIE